MASGALDRPAALDLLADGAWHSGVELGRVLGLSRAAIWKQVRALRALGLSISAERRRGYRLAPPLDLLREPLIRAALAPATAAALEALELPVIIASTNDGLTGRRPPAPGRLLAIAAEYQTGGRGRRGRRWLSPLGHGICLSVGWSFDTAPRDLPALSLVAGVAVVEALAARGVQGVQLKWPNDIVAAGGKLGGILVEVAGEPGGPLRVVVGIGLNVRSLAAISTDLRIEGGALPAVALDDLAQGGHAGRNELVAALLDALYRSLQRFGTAGSGSFLDAWRRQDCLAGQPVQVSQGEVSFTGIARGVADDGALLVERDGALVAVVAGDVTLRGPAGPGRMA